MWEVFLKGGPVMWPLLLCSIVALAVVMERGITFWKIRGGEREGLLRRLAWAIGQGRYLAALQMLEEARTPMARVLAAGMSALLDVRRGVQTRENPSATPVELRAMEEAMETQGKKELAALGRYLAALDVIVTIAPMLGLLGTVTGIIRSFNVLNALAGATDPVALSVGIAEALITTAAGLMIAIPTVVCLVFFQNRIAAYAQELNQAGEELLSLMQAKEVGEYEPDLSRSAQTAPRTHQYD